ncbi:hypothetical protein G7046_g3516 [Stylonectria norvegica]|nr:hypothetical protein G7046_g3516 [Stylonectria norvegica]
MAPTINMQNPASYLYEYAPRNATTTAFYRNMTKLVKGNMTKLVKGDNNDTKYCTPIMAFIFVILMTIVVTSFLAIMCNDLEINCGMLGRGEEIPRDRFVVDDDSDVELEDMESFRGKALDKMPFLK